MGYIHSPDPIPVWQSGVSRAQGRAAIQQPFRYSGAQRNYSSESRGPVEFSTPTFDRIVNQATRAVGTAFLYNRLGHGMEQHHQPQQQQGEGAIQVQGGGLLREALGEGLQYLKDRRSGRTARPGTPGAESPADALEREFARDDLPSKTTAGSAPGGNPSDFGGSMHTNPASPGKFWQSPPPRL